MASSIDRITAPIRATVGIRRRSKKFIILLAQTVLRMNGGKDTLHRGGNRPVKYAGSLYGGDQIHDDLLDSAVSRYIHCLLGGL